MNLRSSLLGLALVAGTLFTTPVFGGYTPDPNAPRSAVPAEYQWRPSDLFATDQAWQAEYDRIKADIPNLGKWQGHVGDSSASMLECFEALQNNTRALYRLWVYANIRFDVDQSVDENQARKGKVEMLVPDLGRVTAYLNPELVAMDQAKVDSFLKENEKLRVYSYFIQEIRRLKDHTLSQKEEAILALAANLGDVPYNTHGSLMNVDLTYGKMKDEEGKEIELSQTGFTKYRASKVFEVRKEASRLFFNGLRSHENTFASLLDGVVKAHVLDMQAHKYGSTLEAALAPRNLTPASYKMLIDTVNANLPRTLHKYIALRKKVLGLSEPMSFPNLYNPLIPSKDLTYTYEQGSELIASALKPMGTDYVTRLRKGMDPKSGWVDVYPNAKKDGGAYMSGDAYDVHPFVLLNFTDTFDDVSTAAHEYGHAMHSVYSNGFQPFVYADYPIFLAEIASTTNEEILLTYMLKQAKDPETRLNLLNQRLETMRQTIFRQTLFAEFEMRIHEVGERGEPLTADVVNGIYKNLITKYYGPEYVMGPNDEVEWAFIPHFYYNYYVFSYATGLTSGISLSKQINQKGKAGEAAAQRYIESFLKAGSSAPPLEILKRSGVDLETPLPIVDAMDLFEQTVTEFDTLWTKTYGTKK